jgi:hypothetical protein
MGKSPISEIAASYLFHSFATFIYCFLMLGNHY